MKVNFAKWRENDSENCKNLCFGEKKQILAETLSGSHKIVEEKENGRTQDMI